MWSILLGSRARGSLIRVESEGGLLLVIEGGCELGGTVVGGISATG